MYYYRHKQGLTQDTSFTTPKVSKRMANRGLVSRDEERETLRSIISRVLTGHGQIVLVTGEQGIGKTVLVEQCLDDAAVVGLRCLVARADPTVTLSPYDVWIPILEQLDTPAASILLNRIQSGTVESAGDPQRTIASAITNVILREASDAPVLIAIDELHLADRTSLDALVDLARRISQLAILIIVNYRDDLPRMANPLREYLAILLRLPDMTRIPLRRLPDDALALLVTNRYHLSPRDQRRLSTYLVERSSGNPLVATEILYELEAMSILAPPRDGSGLWSASDLPLHVAPPVVHDLVSRRLDSLDEEVRQALTIAAVLGQDVDLDLWREIAGLSEDDLDYIIEQAVEKQILHERSDGYSFRHPSVRSVLDGDIILPRRRRLHRRIGETLMSRQGVDPHHVAHHLSQARDPRAVEWLVRAGRHGEGTDAWLTASERYESAVDILIDGDSAPRELASILYRLALVTRYADPVRAQTWLDEALREAKSAGAHGIVAGILHHRGLIRCWTGDIEAGIREMERAITEIESLSDPEYEDLQGIVHFGDRAAGEHRGTLIDWHSDLGRFGEVLQGSDEVRVPEIPANVRELARISPAGDRLSGIAGALACAGRYTDAAKLYTTAQHFFNSFGHHHAVGWMLVEMLQLVAIPTAADQPRRLEELAVAAVQAWERSSSALYSAYPRVALLPLLYLQGEWDQAQTLGNLCRGKRPGHESFLDPIPILGEIALRTGDQVTARTLIQELLPDGMATVPGTRPFLDTVQGLRLGALLALNSGLRDRAEQYVDVFDQWVDWSGARSYGPTIAMLRAQIARQSDDLVGALNHATRSLAQAIDLGRLLDRLAALRDVGELALISGDLSNANFHLAQALELLEGINSPYERAMTLTIVAQLRLAQQRPTEARAAAEEAWLIATRLGAAPLLESVNSLVTAEVAGHEPNVIGSSNSVLSRLSPKELQVLQRLVRGETTREIAFDLEISVRTAERHVSNIYLKLDVTQRSQAIAVAIRHGIH